MARCAVPVAERSVRRRNDCVPIHGSTQLFRPLLRGRGRRSAPSLPGDSFTHPFSKGSRLNLPLLMSIIQTMTHRSPASRILLAFWLFCLMGLSSRAGVIQVDVRTVLTGRAVTTLTDGKLVPWTQGVDGGGHGDGYLTAEAAAANGDPATHALPGDGRFPATAAHPQIQLNFSNRDGQGSQTRGVAGAGEFAFPVPKKHYERMMVFLTSSEGPSRLHFKLNYADGTFDQRDILLPDYYNDPSAGDPYVFLLATNLAKWNATGRMAERDHHNIHGVELHPDSHKKLISVQAVKTAPGYLVFWGATGVTKQAAPTRK